MTFDQSDFSVESHDLISVGSRVDQSDFSLGSHNCRLIKFLSEVTRLLTNQISATHCMWGCARRQQLANYNYPCQSQSYKHHINTKLMEDSKQGFAEQWSRDSFLPPVPRLKIWAGLIYTSHTAQGLSANTVPHWLLISEEIPTLRCSFLAQPHQQGATLPILTLTYHVQCTQPAYHAHTCTTIYSAPSDSAMWQAMATIYCKLGSACTQPLWAAHGKLI